MKHVYIRSITQNLLQNTCEVQCVCRVDDTEPNSLVPQIFSIPADRISTVPPIIISVIGALAFQLNINETAIRIVTELTAEEILTLPPINAPLPFRV